MSVEPENWPKAFIAYSVVYVPVLGYALLHWGV